MEVFAILMDFNFILFLLLLPVPFFIYYGLYKLTVPKKEGIFSYKGKLVDRQVTMAITFIVVVSILVWLMTDIFPPIIVMFLIISINFIRIMGPSKGISGLIGEGLNKYFIGQSLDFKTSHEIYYVIMLDVSSFIICMLSYKKLDKLKIDLEQIKKGFNPLTYDYASEGEVTYENHWKGHKLTELFLKENQIRQLLYKDGYLHKI